jgi:Na+/citrate or Na+/malate symporter
MISVEIYSFISYNYTNKQKPSFEGRSMLVMQKDCFPDEMGLLDLSLDPDSHSFTVGWTLAPCLLLSCHLAGAWLKLPQTNCRVVKLRALESCNALAMASTSFLVGESLIFKDWFAFLGLNGSMGEETNQSFHSLHCH